MKKKILFVSIFSVALLILLSFTNVVGIQTVKRTSDSVTSPLFSIRNKRAINEEQNVETCSYLGKGKDIPILLPKRDNKKALIQDLITRISHMDDKSLSELIITIISRLKQDDKSHDIDARKIILALHLLRTQPDKVQDYINAERNDYFKTDTYIDCTFAGDWYPGCNLIKLLLIILTFVESLITLLILLISSNTPTCFLVATCGNTCTGPSFCLVGC